MSFTEYSQPLNTIRSPKSGVYQPARMNQSIEEEQYFSEQDRGSSGRPADSQCGSSVVTFDGIRELDSQYRDIF